MQAVSRSELPRVHAFWQTLPGVTVFHTVRYVTVTNGMASEGRTEPEGCNACVRGAVCGG